MKNSVCRYFFNISVVFFLLFSGCSNVTLADTIKLKNGQTITGKIINYTARKFVIVYERSSADTRATILLEDIDSVDFDGRPLPAQNSPDVNASVYNDPISTTEPVVTKNPEKTPTSPTNTESIPSPQARESLVNVIAKDDWTYSKIDVQKGDRIKINTDGKIRLNGSRECSPDGIELEDSGKLMQDRPTGALIAVIGDDNDDFMFVGKSREFTAQRSGKLFLSVNEGDLSDNSGSFSAKIQIEKR